MGSEMCIRDSGQKELQRKRPHRSWAHRWRGESAPGTALRTAHRPGCYPPPLRVPDTVHGRHHHSRRSAPFRRHFSATRWSSGAHGFEAALEEPARCRFSPAIHPALQCPGPAKRPPFLKLTSRSSQAGCLGRIEDDRQRVHGRLQGRQRCGARAVRPAPRTSACSRTVRTPCPPPDLPVLRKS